MRITRSRACMAIMTASVFLGAGTAMAAPSPVTAAALCASQGGQYADIGTAYYCDDVTPVGEQFSNMQLAKARHECVVLLDGTFEIISGASDGSTTTPSGYGCTGP